MEKRLKILLNQLNVIVIQWLHLTTVFVSNCYTLFWLQQMTMTAVCLQFFTQKNYSCIIIIVVVVVITNIEYSNIQKNRVKIAVSNNFSSIFQGKIVFFICSKRNCSREAPLTHVTWIQDGSLNKDLIGIALSGYDL